MNFFVFSSEIRSVSFSMMAIIPFSRVGSLQMGQSFSSDRPGFAVRVKVWKQRAQVLSPYNSETASEISLIFVLPSPAIKKASRIAWRGPMEGNLEKISVNFFIGSDGID